MFICPKCNEKSITMKKKFFSSPFRYLVCPKCKSTLIIPFWSLISLIPLLVSAKVGYSLSSLIMKYVIIVIGLLLTSLVYLYLIPIQAKKGSDRSD